MNPRLTHLLADDQLAARYADDLDPRAPRGVPARSPLRARLGMLLVAAGLHLVTSAEPSSRPPALAS